MNDLEAAMFWAGKLNIDPKKLPTVIRKDMREYMRYVRGCNL